MKLSMPGRRLFLTGVFENIIDIFCMVIIDTLLSSFILIIKLWWIIVMWIGYVETCHMNIKRHTLHIIVSWHNTKQWPKGHTSDLMMIIRLSTHILTIIIREMDKLNTHSSIYYMKENGENWLNIRHTLNRMYLTSISEIQYLQVHLHNDDNEIV